MSLEILLYQHNKNQHVTDHLFTHILYTCMYVYTNIRLFLILDILIQFFKTLMCLLLSLPWSPILSQITNINHLLLTFHSLFNVHMTQYL